ncbi:MAG TPA: FAD-dependent oxidoreductase [Roseiflexaceae bacterium]|nr:FAD-dependent oxidoreductase [Roseiflexaceae bacterium]
MQTHARLVIIGAGIVGCSAAYHLARLGWRDIVVIDQGPLFATGGSTSHAPGLVFQTNGSQTMCRMAQYAVKLYGELSLDDQPCFYPVGSLEVAYTPERLRDLHRRRGWGRSWGLHSDVIGPAEARAQLPLLDDSKILGALAVPGDGIAKAVRACEAMARFAQAHGASFYGRTPVTGFETAGGRVTAVLTGQGRIATEQVLLCGGIWGPKVGRLAGVSVPLTPCQHQYVRTTPLRELLGETREVVHPILRHQDKAMYARQVGNSYGVGSYQHTPLLVCPDDIRPHETWVSATEITEKDNNNAFPQPSAISVASVATWDMPSVMPFTPEHFDGPWQDMAEILPTLRGADFAATMNGMFSFTPDGNPVVGEAPNLRGFWVAEAVWVTHGGGVGKAVAELMATGSAEWDMRDCDIDRFEPHAHSAPYVLARGWTQYDEVYDILHPLQQMEQPRPLRTSPFYARQQALGAVFFEGRGWERPQWFESNVETLKRSNVQTFNPRLGWAARCWSPIAGAEHLATREHIALYDMTPLTRCEVAGPGALAFLQHLTTNQLEKPAGSVVYTCMCDERGGVRSDVTVTRLAESEFQVACNGPADIAWLRRHAPEDGRVLVRETTPGTCCVGVWGPRARELVQPLSGDDFSNETFPYFTARRVYIGEVPCMAQRVSYVGELGWEIYTSADYGLRLWDLLWAAGQPLGAIAAGRTAFDALRLEKGYRLWGADMHAEHTPYEAGLGFTVKLDKGDFLGRDALIRAKERGLSRKLCCMVLDDSAHVVLGKEPIWADGQVVGYVSSATYGYSVGKSFAYGYLPIELASAGARVEIEYFGECYGATVAREPLFDPHGARLRS